MTCRYIDDYHLETGSYRGENLYHICEFAERMEQAECQSIIPLRASLPEKCFSYLETTGEMIIIEKGEKGYTPTNAYPLFFRQGKRTDALIGPLREFCVSDFRQNQEYHVFNVQDEGLFPLSKFLPVGWDGMRAGTA